MLRSDTRKKKTLHALRAVQPHSAARQFQELDWRAAVEDERDPHPDAAC
jgi:hypothetical protein